MAGWNVRSTTLALLLVVNDFRLKAEEYARACGVNYVDFMWALIYESLFVVFIPIGSAELTFYRRREQCWLNTTGVVLITSLFLPACFLAWYSWTQIARIQVFQQEAFNPPLSQILISAVLLIWLAVRLRVSQSLRNTPVLNQPM